MNSPADANGRPPARDLLRLVRHVVSGRRLSLRRENDDVLLQGEGETARRHRHIVLEDALRLGLVSLDGGFVCATVQASAFLRRALIEPEEAFQSQHRDIIERTERIDGNGRTVRVNLAESPLGSLVRLKDKSGAAFMPAEGLEAGERLARDFTRAQLQPRLTMQYEPRLSSRSGGASPAADISDTALAARLRVRRAVEALGPELCGVALDVCCFGKGLETVERERQWPARSAKLMLRTALMALSRHYAPPKPAAGRVHAWGGEGYRPDMG